MLLHELFLVACITRGARLGAQCPPSRTLQAPIHLCSELDCGECGSLAMQEGNCKGKQTASPIVKVQLKDTEVKLVP